MCMLDNWAQPCLCRDYAQLLIVQGLWSFAMTCCASLCESATKTLEEARYHLLLVVLGWCG